MFGINDNKSAGQDPVMPQPLESPGPAVSYGAAQAAGTAPPLGSDVSAAPPPTPHDSTDGSTHTDGQPQPYPPLAQAPTTAPVNTTGAPEDELLRIKQEALQNLAPLVNQLDQTPEEKFKTTMMMLQASDNSELVQAAYDAANKITDEKTRAQALLDVVNEINYFTHHDAGA
ncbi:MAG: hypothetical protein ABSD10_03370 [Candidatus Saccharimonadales bacterium]|jgi:hypothetical protein